MLRSLYAYNGTHSRTLKFLSHEKFLEIGSSNDANWVHVINEKGLLGYVPKNYVALDQVPPHEMVELIDLCIESIHHVAGERSNNYTHNEHEALQSLIEMRQVWHAKIPPSIHPSKRPAPPPPNRASSQPTGDFTGSQNTLSLISTPCQPPPPLNSPQTDIEYTRTEVATSFISINEEPMFNGDKSFNSQVEVDRDVYIEKRSSQHQAPVSIPIPSIAVRDVVLDLKGPIPKGYCRQLVEEIRANTNISYSTSHQVVSIVFKSLGLTFPSLNPILQEILNERLLTQSHERQSPLNCWEDSGDGRKLVEILEKLRQCKDDDQQRSWALHEDEFVIKEMINNLIDVLTNGDMEVCKSVLLLDDYRPLLTIVQYYQMETRWVLRKLLLQVFAACCQLSLANISYLSSSVLPSELTRVILHSKTSEEELEYTSLILGMVLSMGDTLPFNHFSIMNETFIEEVLSGIESYHEYPETENLAELYLTLILAFNLQFTAASCKSDENSRKNEPENLVIKVLSRRTETRYFIEKLLILFNREEDPVAMFDHEPHPPHSVLCMMGDVFRCPKTAQLLYTNDEKVVCDIILRQLTDLPPEDKRRNDYLCLLEGVLTLGRWKEHQHRRKEFYTRLNSFSKSDECVSDKMVASRILQAVPELR